MARLVKLSVENFKKIQAIEFEPEGNLTIVGGMNEQGKSSLLDSISVLLGGKSVKIPEPVRRGTKKATITGEILKDSWDAFDDMTIVRTITAAGNWYVKIQDKNGNNYKSPETMLKKIFGEPLDPVEFVKMLPKDRVETLKRITGLDFSELEAAKKEAYDERVFVGREVKEIEGSLARMESYPDAPIEKVSLSELLENLSNIQEGNRENDDKKEELEELEEDINNKELSLEALQVELQQLQEKIHNAQVSINIAREDRDNLKDIVCVLVYADEQDIKNQIAAVEETNNQVEVNIRFAEESEKLDTKKLEYQALTDKIKKIDTEKQQQLSAAEFPVDGLSFDEDNVFYNGLAFDEKQLSSEELLRVSFAIAIAARPNLKNILIREGSLLDKNNLKLIGKMAEDAGIHVFVETVGDGSDGKATIVIENGEIKKSELANVAEEEFEDI